MPAKPGKLANTLHPDSAAFATAQRALSALQQFSKALLLLQRSERTPLCRFWAARQDAANGKEASNRLVTLDRN